MLMSFFTLFKSSTPKNFSEFLFEIKFIYYGLKSNISDATIGKYYNRISLFKQTSKVCVLTGGNRGIGLQILKKLLQCEMTVILGVRNIDAAKKSVESSIDNSLLMNRVIYEKCDTSDMNSVREFASRVQERCKNISLLINNAGIMGIPYVRTKDNFESQMAINYLGHFLLTHLLMPQLIAAGNDSNVNSRIINVSSCAHFAGKINYDDFNCEKYYHMGEAYADSKLAQMMFTRYSEKICKEKGWKVSSFAPHPGVVDTEIFQNSVIGSFKLIRRIFMKTPEQGARSIIYAAISTELEKKGGIYITNCRPTTASKIARNDVNCKKFFEFSCEILKIKEFGIK
ncbi:hypothetical protein PVAND_003078 [Polypedilum vanderplanki]|uniref:Short chain dehydrogenase n=1 Tax=Polypedilum vanderplanki TaxID=319348 RepID=A0A9J6BTV2_POLVA|nr:hypothetical protein PVAND_003078 [Polypedilum vanderplanki]